MEPTVAEKLAFEAKWGVEWADRWNHLPEPLRSVLPPPCARQDSGRAAVERLRRELRNKPLPIWPFGSVL